jgi:hypothetical protein
MLAGAPTVTWPAWTADEDARLREVFAPNAPRPSKREWG